MAKTIQLNNGDTYIAERKPIYCESRDWNGNLLTSKQLGWTLSKDGVVLHDGKKGRGVLAGRQFPTFKDIEKYVRFVYGKENPYADEVAPSTPRFKR